MNHAEMTKKYYQNEIMVKEQERRLHGIVAELVAVKLTIGNVIRELNQRRARVDQLCDELLQPIDVSGWDKHEGENLELEGAEMSAKGENL